MFRNYLKATFRNIFRHKVYSLINVSGLAIGITSAILILLWVQDELSYDRFHEKADRIYRVDARGVIGNTYNNQTGTPAPLAVALKNDFPEVEQAVRFYSVGEGVGRYGDKEFIEKKIIATDSTFFDVFSFALLKGDPGAALVEPASMVVTEETAQRYFGDKDPLGKVIIFDDRLEVRVTGVMENIPDNSHFHFDMFISMASVGFSRNTRWMSNSFRTYLVLREGHTPEQLEAKFPDVIEKSVYANYPDMFKGDSNWEYFLQAMPDIHLYSDLNGEFEANGNIMYVYIFSIVAFMILIVACVNFVNLTTARSANRAKEVGLRKVIGSTRKQIVLQHMTESFSLVLIAFSITMVIIELILPYFNAFVGKTLEFSVLNNSRMFLQLLGLIVFVGILSGSYPAVYLSSFRPVAVMSGRLRQGMKNSALRNALVVFQFGVTITLFIGTFIVAKQLDYFLDLHDRRQTL